MSYLWRYRLILGVAVHRRWTYAGLSVDLCGPVGVVWGPLGIRERSINLAVQMEFEAAALLSKLVPGPCVRAVRTEDD